MPVETRDHRDYYRELGVTRTAGPDEIQRAYRALARRYHPDVNRRPGAEDRFKAIAEAYQVLSNPRTRREHDEATRPPASPRPQAHPHTHPNSYPHPYPSTADAGDLMSTLFGGLGAPPVPGADIQAELTVGVEDVYQGGRRRITLPGPAGRPRQYSVDIPAGVVDGQRLRLAGQGAAGSAGGRPGDLFLVVRLAPHPRFRVRGRDVMVEVPVSPWEAALGAVVPVAGPGGEVRLDVPAGSSSGRRLRLRGRGLPDPRGTPGDLFAEVRIVVPDRLSGRERQHFEALSRESSFDPREPLSPSTENQPRRT